MAGRSRRFRDRLMVCGCWVLLMTACSPEAFWEKTLQAGQQALGPDHPEMAKSLDDLASLLRKAKREQEADALAGKAAGLKTAASLPTPSSW